MDINQLISNLRKVDFKEAMEIAINSNPGLYAQAQRNQMLRGERNNGKKIGKYKSKAYTEKKYALNQLAGKGYKDEKLTGEFHRLIFVEARRGVVVFSSSDTKTNDIMNRDGEDIFGLNKESVAEVAPTLAKDSNAIVKKVIYGL